MNLFILVTLMLMLNCCQPPTSTAPPLPVGIAAPLPSPPTEEERKRKDTKEIKQEPPEDKSIHAKTKAIQQSVNKAWSAAVRYQHIIQEDKQ